MNTAELAASIAEKFAFSKVTARKILKHVTETICVEVRKGKRVELTRFGSFQKVERKARTARNPQTGEAVAIPKRAVPKFRPGKQFREEVANLRNATARASSRSKRR